MVAREQGGEVAIPLSSPQPASSQTKGKSEYLHGVPAEPHTTLCLPFVQGASMERMQGSRLHPALPLPRGCLLPFSSTVSAQQFQEVSVLVLSFLTPSSVLVSTSPSGAEPQ